MSENNQWFQDILNKGLQTFVEYWGYAAIEEQWRVKGSISGGQGWVKDRVEALQNALKFDETGLTAFMVLRAYLHRHLHSTTYSAYDLILDWESKKAEFEKIAAMRAELERPDALEVLNDYHQNLKEMAAAYEYQDLKEYAAAVVDPVNVGFLRYSAFMSLNKKLKAHQFLQGAGGGAEFRIHKKIYEFWNINSLINAAAHQIFDGAALCLIRDPEHFFASFFVFAVKAGDTLTILTDRHKGAHPRYNDMSRRPDRDMMSRINENWFPYDLLDIEVIETERGDIWKERTREQLVPYQSELIPLANLGDLSFEQMTWIGILLDLIAKKYGGEKPLLLPELSYTGEMIRTPTVLVPDGSSLIVSGQYKPLELPVITPDDITAAKVASNFEKPSYGFNRHIFERFKDKVPAGVFNLLGNADVKLLRESNDILGTLKKKTFSSDPPEHKIELRNFSPLDFGTPAELNKDRIWTARFNQISYIDHLAKKEYESEKDNVLKWFDEKVRANKKNLIACVAAMECRVVSGLWLSNMWNDPENVSFPMRDRRKEKIVNILSFSYATKKLWSLFSYSTAGVRFVWTDKSTDRESFYRCFENGTKANIGATFTPTEASHLAILAGCEVEDLPEQIRFWVKDEPYVGNSILDRLDPEDWFLDDYFRKMDLTVSFAMSKSYFNQLRKDYGYPRYDFEAKDEKDE
jgi:hypothetical protein